MSSMHAPDQSLPELSDVSETLLIPLCIRALETQRPDALMRDERAVALLRQLELDPARLLAHVEEQTRVALLLRNRRFDSYTQEFMARFPGAAVIHIGCGLDARFERVDDGRVDWYDLDLPQVIELRQRLIGGEGPRYHPLAGSVLEEAWLESASPLRGRSCLFLAEGIFMYFDEAQVRGLVLRLREAFSGAELAFDAFSPFFAWAGNLRVRLTGIGARAGWSMRRATEPEGWGEGIRLLDEYFPFMDPEPRLLQAPRIARAPWVLRLPFFARTWGVFRYQLGERAG